MECAHGCGDPVTARRGSAHILRIHYIFSVGLTPFSFPSVSPSSLPWFWNLPSHFLQKRGLKRETATLTVCLLAVLGFIVFWAYLLPPLVSQTGDFFKALPNILGSGVAKLDASLKPSGTIPPVVLSAQTVQPTPALPATNQLTLAEPPAAPVVQTELLTTEPDHYQQGRKEIQEWLMSNLPAIQATIQKNIATVIYSSMGPVGQAFGVPARLWFCADLRLLFPRRPGPDLQSLA